MAKTLLTQSPDASARPRRALPLLALLAATAALPPSPLPAATVTLDELTPVRAFRQLDKRAATGENTIPALLEAVRSYATIGEMCDVLRDLWGEYEEVPAV